MADPIDALLRPLLNGIDINPIWVPNPNPNPNPNLQNDFVFNPNSGNYLVNLYLSLRVRLREIDTNLSDPITINALKGIILHQILSNNIQRYVEVNMARCSERLNSISGKVQNFVIMIIFYIIYSYFLENFKIENVYHLDDSYFKSLFSPKGYGFCVQFITKLNDWEKQHGEVIFQDKTKQNEDESAIFSMIKTILIRSEYFNLHLLDYIFKHPELEKYTSKPTDVAVLQLGLGPPDPRGGGGGGPPDRTYFIF